MKNLFGIDVKDDKKVYSLFETKKVSEELVKKTEENFIEIEKSDKAASLPLYLNVIFYICLYGFLILTLSLINALKDKSFSELLKNNLLLLIITVALGIGALLLFVIRRMKNKKVINSDEFKETIEESNDIYNECMEYLGVPSEAPSVDAFVYLYKVKKDKTVPAINLCKYFVQEFRIYKDENNLCLADCESVLSLPLDSFKKIELIDKKVSFMNWNKAEQPNKGEYKQYKITTNNYGVNFIKPYYRIEFEYNFENYEFFVPVYDIKPFEEIINLSITNQSEI